jgi:hypothetical protein
MGETLVEPEGDVVDPLGVVPVELEPDVELDEVLPDGVVPDGVVPEDVVPEDVVPEDVVPEGVVPDADPGVVPVGVPVVDPVVDPEGDPEVADAPDPVEELSGLVVATFPPADPDVDDPDVLALPPVLVPVGLVGETGTFELVAVLLVLEVGEALLFPLPPMTPRPNSRANVSNANARSPPMIHQAGWQSGVSF